MLSLGLKIDPEHNDFLEGLHGLGNEATHEPGQASLREEKTIDLRRDTLSGCGAEKSQIHSIKKWP